MQPIINNEQHRNKLAVWVEKLIMLVCTALLWYFALRYIFTELVVDNYQKTLDTFVFLGIVSGIIFLVILLWQEYNIYMYRKADRRKSRGLATDSFVAAKFHIASEHLPALRSAAYLQVRKENTVSCYSGDGLREEVCMNMYDEEKTGGL